ncbi:MAG: nitrogen fixation protein NifQ [Hyphomicrobiaceae bacterium]|nr:nitrogen fixation protein NifQ [Hyphomicrobiaceae bacterium]
MLDIASYQSAEVEPEAPGAEAAAAGVFDRGIAFSILAKALSEQAARGGSLAGRLGLTHAELLEFAAFCGWTGLERCEGKRGDEVVPEEQAWVRDLLRRHAEPGSRLAAALAPIVARRAMEANHLWEDLGLDSRGALTRLMQRHFGPLARLNTDNMRWKRFLYRRLCEEEGVMHCTSPTCSICPDVDACFEDGSLERAIAVGKQAPR